MWPSMWVFNGAAVPRRYSASDTAAPLTIAAGAVEPVAAVTLGRPVQVEAIKPALKVESAWN